MYVCMYVCMYVRYMRECGVRKRSRTIFDKSESSTKLTSGLRADERAREECLEYI